MAGMTEYEKLVAAIPENYPEYVKRTLRDDILKRAPDDNVWIAYELAQEMHDGQTRKGRHEIHYITHPLRVYDFVNRCVDKNHEDRDALLMAALLHDVPEDYRPKNYDEENETHESREKARSEAYQKINDRLAGNPLKDKIISILEEETNPIIFRDVFGQKTTKEKWQVEHMLNKQTSVQAKILKIADQSANLISDLEEIPTNWDYDKITAYRKKADAVVSAGLKNISHADMLEGSTEMMGKFYKLIANYHKHVLDDLRRLEKPIPPDAGGHEYANINIDGIERTVKGIKKGQER